MTAATQSHSVAPGRPNDDPFRAYDWKIIFFIDGQPHEGAIGRTGAQGRCRDRVTEEMRQLPSGVEARGEIVRTSVDDPDIQCAVAVAMRARDGTITWSDG